MSGWVHIKIPQSRYSRATIDPCARIDPMSVTRPVACAKSCVHAGLVIGQTKIVLGFIWSVITSNPSELHARSHDGGEDRSSAGVSYLYTTTRNGRLCAGVPNCCASITSDASPTITPGLTGKPLRTFALSSFVRTWVARPAMLPSSASGGTRPGGWTRFLASRSCHTPA